MMRKVFDAFSLALAVTLLPSAAIAHAGHDHGTKAKKVKKPKPKKGAALGPYGAISLGHAEVDREQQRAKSMMSA
jgi:hypothetical protein